MPNRQTRRFNTTPADTILERAQTMFPNGLTVSFSPEEITSVLCALGAHANACVNASDIAADFIAVSLRVRILERLNVEEM